MTQWQSRERIFPKALNKAVVTILRDLSKPPQKNQGLDPRPLWLLVGTPSVLAPELVSRRAEHWILWRMSLYIYIYIWYTVLSPYMFVLELLWPLRSGCLLVIDLHKRGLFTNFLMCGLLITQIKRLEGSLGSRKPVFTTHVWWLS